MTRRNVSPSTLNGRLVYRRESNCRRSDPIVARCLSVTVDEVEAEAQRGEPVVEAPPREGRSHRKHPGRERLPEHLKRVESIVACQDRNCACCGQETEVFDYDISEQLDVEPARYFVRVIKREKRVCRHCERPNGKSAVLMAPLAPRIAEKGLASDALRSTRW
jgi:transposase